MREAIVTLFKEKFNVPLYQGMTPEQVTYPVGAYAIADDIVSKELDGSGVTSREVIFDVDIVCNNMNEVDLYRNMLIDLSGKSSHRWRNLFQLMIVRSLEDVGPLLGVTTDADNPPQILAIRLSFFQ